MTGNEPEVGDRVHSEGRPHPNREGWLQANGEIINIIYASDDEDDDPEPYEAIVRYDEDDYETYFIEQLEWCTSIGGYWRVT
jgi:hypothetical protein